MMSAVVAEMTTPRVEGADDMVLVRRSIAGDSRAFEALVRRHYERALRVSYGLLKSRTEAEDVVQDAFVRVHMRLAEFRAASGFYTWLYRIVVNLSIDRLRKLRRERQVDLEEEDSREALSRGRSLWPKFETHDPQSSMQRRQLSHRIQVAFDALPDIHQAVIVLREVEGLSYEEIAETLQIKKGTVMSRLFHARKGMQKLLLEQEQDEQQNLERWVGFSEPGLVGCALA